MFESVSVGTPGQSKVLVVAHFKGEALDKHSAGLDKSGALVAALTRAEATGESGACVDAFPTGSAFSRAIVVGLGDRASFKTCSLRSIAGAVSRRLNAIKEGQAQIEIFNALKGDVAGGKVSVRDAGKCFGEGLGLIGFSHEQFKGTGTTKKSPKIAVAARSGDKRFEEAMAHGLALATAANLTRSLSNTPPNIATPFFMADQAKKLAKEYGLKCDVMSGKDLEKEKMTGHIEVGKASVNKPCVIRLEYTPKPDAKGDAKPAKKAEGKDAKAVKPLVLIGKTLCYDTGGLSLKINNGMVGMKRDKDGGCAVLGAMQAIASIIKPKKPVVAILAAAENSISDEAYRPDDILTYRNGVTVEITNTDAEGRLVLADALCWACEKENPSAIIDLATLTGGVVTALGSTYCGMFCEDDRLRARVEAASDASGERVWRLPMHQEYRDMMKSPIADILNSNPNRKAHPIQGAAFLSYFVKEGIPWCHLDIAGVHVCDKDNGCFTVGPTGWGARLLAELAGAL